MKPILAYQGQTARRRVGEDVVLITLGLVSCVGLLIVSESGNASLTHIDYATDLAFIADEIESVAAGERFSIDLVVNSDAGSAHESPLVQAICSKLLALNVLDSPNLAGVVNSDPAAMTCTPSSTAVLSFEGNRAAISRPTEPDLLERYSSAFRESTTSYQLRVYIRQLNAAISREGFQKPVVIYDQGWRDITFSLAKDAMISLMLPKDRMYDYIKRQPAPEYFECLFYLNQRFCSADYVVMRLTQISAGMGKNLQEFIAFLGNNVFPVAGSVSCSEWRAIVAPQEEATATSASSSEAKCVAESAAAVEPASPAAERFFAEPRSVSSAADNVDEQPGVGDDISDRSRPGVD